MAGNPHIQFYIGDWKKDPAVSFCSPETRGVWFDFLCDMHELKSGGVLTGDAEQLCRSGRCSHAQLLRTIDELKKTRAADVSERNGVYTIICRRMKKESDLSKSRATAGTIGGEASQAKRKQITDIDIDNEVKGLGSEFIEVWNLWIDHRRQIKKPTTIQARWQQIQKLKQWGVPRAIVAIKNSIANGWIGIFEPDKQNTPQKQGMLNVKREAWQIEKDIASTRSQMEKVLDVSRYGYTDGFIKLQKMAEVGDPQAKQDLELWKKLKDRKSALELELRSL